ncbi:signal peptidase I [Geminicoccus flavidas]|uniref:signal peptidase I n=2 Tax=Geminicoccus TaxID=489140 RepID=UPI00135A25BE|nr:signal peptidase I [Geminicoccus flavidas]
MPDHVALEKRKSSSTWETVKTLIYAILIALVVRTFLFEPFNIPSGSMKPTLLVGDYLFVSKYAYGYSRWSFPWGIVPFSGRVFGSLPERGDVAVFKRPGENVDYIKRVVGLPGDRVQMRGGRLFINGDEVPQEPAGTFSDLHEGSVAMYRETLPGGRVHNILDRYPDGPMDDTQEFLVPEGHVFMMGDNRDNSQDSRDPSLGYVPLENLVGRAEILFFSTDGSAGFLEPWAWPFATRFDRLLTTIR